MHLQRIAARIYKICKLRRHITVRTKSTESNVVKSKAPSLIIPNQLIPEYIWQNLDKWHNKTAVVCFETGKSYTFGDVYSKSKNLAGCVRQRFNLRKGDTVAVILPNVVDFPVIFLGLIQAGLVVTTVNPLHNADEITRQLSDSGTKMVFTVRDILAVVNTATETLGGKIPTVGDYLPTGCIKISEICDISSNTNNTFQDVNADDVAILPYSSGTTGISKGVQLTHKNVVSNLYQMSSPHFMVNLKTEGNFQDVIPVFLPLFHIYGMVGIFLNFFAQGCKLIMIPNFIGSQFIKLLQYYQPTLLFAVPPMIAIMLNNPKIKLDDLKSVRTIISAAAPLGTLSVEQFNDKSNGRINLLQMYGMTETSPLTLMQTPKLPNGTKIGGSGFLIPNTEAKIVDPNTGDTVGLNESGELVVRGPQIMKGYHNNAEETRDAMLEGGWLRTGDICYYDEHEHFFITDRLKELIKVKGFQVAPAELEEILKSHSAVVDAAVVGIPHPVHGEAPKAFIVIRKGVTVKADQMKDFVASKVSSYKRLVGGVVIMETIPRNSAGKILRSQLRSM